MNISHNGTLYNNAKSVSKSCLCLLLSSARERKGFNMEIFNDSSHITKIYAHADTYIIACEFSYEH